MLKIIITALTLACVPAADAAVVPAQDDHAVVSRTCYPPHDDLASVIRVTVNDRVDVDLWCGDRVVVRGSRCLVERGAESTLVPCLRGQFTERFQVP